MNFKLIYFLSSLLLIFSSYGNKSATTNIDDSVKTQITNTVDSIIQVNPKIEKLDFSIVKSKMPPIFAPNFKNL